MICLEGTLYLQPIIELDIGVCVCVHVLKKVVIKWTIIRSAHMQEIQYLNSLPVTFGTYIAYKICHLLFVHACADIWSTKISSQIFVSLIIFHVS